MLDSYKNHYHTLFSRTKLKLLPFDKQVETIYVSYRADQL